MRSVISKKKENRTKQIVLGLILVGVMFISVLGYAFQGEEKESNKKIIHNGFEFTNQGDLWFLEIGNFIFAFKYHPKQVEKIGSKVNLLNQYLNKPLYIFSENSESEIEIVRNLEPIVLRMRRAYLEGEEGEENLPIKNCADNFIIIKENNITKISQNQSCVFIQGPKEDLTKITDEFLFKILSVD
ncbi:MAG: hypothetical protein ABH811_02725 [archaeon]